MLSAEENELMCRVGPGTPMGDLMRQYWMPALTSDELPEPDGAPVRVRLLGEDLIAFRTTLRQGRPRRERLPAPRRVAVLRPQRGRGAALRLPRLEVRRRRQLHRHADRAGREQLQGPRYAPSPTRASSATASSGPTWARARPAAAAGPRAEPDRRRGLQVRQDPARVQLGPGARGRRRHQPLRLPPPLLQDRTRSPARFELLHGARPRRRSTRSPTPTSASPTAPTARRKRTATTGASPTSSSPSTR